MLLAGWRPERTRNFDRCLTRERKLRGFPSGPHFCKPFAGFVEGPVPINKGTQFAADGKGGKILFSLEPVVVGSLSEFSMTGKRLKPPALA